MAQKDSTLNATAVVKYQRFDPKLVIGLIGVMCLIFAAVGFLAGVVATEYQHAKLEQTQPKTVALVLPSEPKQATRIVQYTEPEFQDTQQVVWQAKNLEEEIRCLAMNIYFEAKNQDVAGQIAVGNVTINRLLDPAFPDTICDVVWEKRRHPKTGRWVAQFSWTWDGKRDKPTDMKQWESIQRLAGAMLAEGSLFNFYDITDGADHYHALYVKPYWRKKMYVVVVIGDHKFYRAKVKFTPVKSPTVVNDT